MSKLSRFFDRHFDDEDRRCAREYGCALTGIRGLIYYKETCAIYEKFKEDIWTLINEHGGPSRLINANDFRHPVCFENAMVWKAFELYAGLNG